MAISDIGIKGPKPHVAHTIGLASKLERPGSFPCEVEGLRPRSICKTGENRLVCSTGETQLHQVETLSGVEIRSQHILESAPPFLAYS